MAAGSLRKLRRLNMINKKSSEGLQKSMVLLYKKGLGTDKISKKIGMSKTSVRNNLLKKNVRFRISPKDAVNIYLHRRFVELYKKGWSINQIAQNCDFSFSTVQRHLHKEDINLKKRGDPKKILNYKHHQLTSEKAYVLGVVGPGDGFIEYRKDNGVHRVALEATDLDFIKYFSLCLNITYGIKPKIVKLKMRRGDTKIHYKCILQSKAVCDDILNYNANFKEKTWDIPEVIKKASKNIKAKYLQGMADSQGSVANYDTTKCVVLCSRNEIGKKEIASLLKDVGIDGLSIRKVGVFIKSRRPLENFAKCINFNIKRKKENLYNLINGYKMYQTPNWKVSMLKSKIIELRKNELSYSGIGKKLNISTSTAWRHSKHIVKDKNN